MSVSVISSPTEGLVKLGLHGKNTIHYQLNPEELVQHALRLKEGVKNNSGALVIKTGEFTGRAPKDKFTVKDEITENTVNWNEFNLPLEEKFYHIIHKKITDYLNNRPELWVRDAQACADSRFRIHIRTVNEKPANDLFIYNMFLRPQEEELDSFKPDWHMLVAPGLKLDATECGVRQHNAVVVSFTHRTILIAGTGYTGEMKKSIFGILNYILPQNKGVLPMHCSANIGKNGDTALFFGLSGTGKTTLSADSSRDLIGDDEHGWTNEGIFNFEGGCYAKCIDLSEEKEPEIFQAVRQGALVENTVFYPGTNKIDFSNSSITENTRVSYPLDYISNSVEPALGGIPRNIFFLTCDAYGVLPPISRLSPAQAMYQFISGYTAKVAGTETGITEPKSTFSACFGAPFFPLHPGKYAAMLGEKLRKHNVQVWLVNTGWTGGEYGVGHRLKLSYTRALIGAALNGSLDPIQYETHPVFGVEMPLSCPNVPDNILNPRNTWANHEDYDHAAISLAKKFAANFEKYAAGVQQEIRDAGPKI